MGLFNKRKQANKRDTVSLQVAKSLQIVRECASIVNSTTAASEFFPRYNLMLEHLDTLAGLEAYGNFGNSPELPSVALERVSRQFVAATNEFLCRAYNTALDRRAGAEWLEETAKYLEQMPPESASYFCGLRDEYNAKTVAERDRLRRWNEAHSDTQYQETIARYYNLLTSIREQYQVIKTLSTFDSNAGRRLIADCVEAINIEQETHEKHEYYENRRFDISEPSLTLAQIYETLGDYERATAVCAMAIQNGFTGGQGGGMRGRLAHIIKKGDLPLTEDMKELLNL